jgi:hypothetical protein
MSSDQDFDVDLILGTPPRRARPGTDRRSWARVDPSFVSAALCDKAL